MYSQYKSVYINNLQSRDRYSKVWQASFHFKKRVKYMKDRQTNIRIEKSSCATKKIWYQIPIDFKEVSIYRVPAQQQIIFCQGDERLIFFLAMFFRDVSATSVP